MQFFNAGEPIYPSKILKIKPIPTGKVTDHWSNFLKNFTQYFLFFSYAQPNWNYIISISVFFLSIFTSFVCLGDFSVHLSKIGKLLRAIENSGAVGGGSCQRWECFLWAITSGVFSFKATTITITITMIIIIIIIIMSARRL
jgi:hypothetical protein